MRLHPLDLLWISLSVHILEICDGFLCIVEYFCWVVGAINPPRSILKYMGCNIIVMNLNKSVLG